MLAERGEFITAADGNTPFELPMCDRSGGLRESSKRTDDRAAERVGEQRDDGEGDERAKMRKRSRRSCTAASMRSRGTSATKIGRAGVREDWRPDGAVFLTAELDVFRTVDALGAPVTPQRSCDDKTVVRDHEAGPRPPSPRGCEGD